LKQHANKGEVKISMKKPALFIHGAGDGAYEEDGLLVASLQDALGDAYIVHYPQMPADYAATYADWKRAIELELNRVDYPVVLVGHSVGACALLNYLAKEQINKPIAGLFLLAAPYWGADEYWTWDEMTLPQDVSKKLTNIPRIFFYHSQDDEIVPFTHLALYTALLPHATFRVLDGRGHQFGNNLVAVALDITHASDIQGQ
jgi:predicted alpha/beta hydrolase family esterase